MKSHTKKSSITLPPLELKLVNELKKYLGAKSKVAVIRKGLTLLKERADRANLRQQYVKASRATRNQIVAESQEWGELGDEGIE